ncbi:MAG: DNA (cytosine-5-)-methyltransferase [Alphaproteobacteria bacterium]|nr:DNA (cytosine-5-)-methyltransferase [Alphaproteobacteria bacterium]
MYKVVSLFAGCGGCDLGILGDFEYNNQKYKKLPYKIIYALDIDEKALATHSLNFKTNQLKCGDICNILSDEIPDCDIVIGGFPCQSFSTVNPTKDPFDDRANLYKQMVRIVKDKQPKAFIAENVKGLLTLHNGKIFKKICKAFENAGYTLSYKLLNAADYGVPQKRERVVIVGIRNDLNKKYLFPKAPNVGKWIPLSSVIKDLAMKDQKYYFSERAVKGMKNAKPNMKRGLWQNLDEPCLTITSHLAKVSLNSRDPVLLVDSKKELYRRFTPREAARIQSFPENFKFAGSETSAYRQIGNAVPPVLFWHIAKDLSKTLVNA